MLRRDLGTFVVTLWAGARLASAQAPAAGSFKAMSAAGCEKPSFSPEVYEFFGDSGSVLAKLEKFDMDLPNRRLYILSVETGDATEFSIFERKDAEKVAVMTWKGTGQGDLGQKISDAIIANRGIACVGEQSKGLISKAVKLEDKGSIPKPVSAMAAFAHPIKSYGTKYIRATIYLMC